jgi:hypothetical protein
VGLDVGHAQWVFTVPKRLPIYFLRHRELLGPLARLAAETAKELLTAAAGEAEGFRPGVVSVVQTYQPARTSFMSITMMLGLPDPSRDREPDVAREAEVPPLTARSMPLRSGLSGDEGHGGLGMWGRAGDCISPSDVIQDAPDAGPPRRRAG